MLALAYVLMDNYCLILNNFQDVILLTTEAIQRAFSNLLFVQKGKPKGVTIKIFKRIKID